MAKIIKTKSGSVSDERHSLIIGRNTLLIVGVILFFLFKPFIIAGLLGAAILHGKAKNLKKESLTEKAINNELSRLPDDYAVFSNLIFKYSKDMIVNVKYLIIGEHKIFIVGATNGDGLIEGDIKDKTYTCHFEDSSYKMVISNPFVENNAVIFAVNVVLSKLNISRDPESIVLQLNDDVQFNIRGLEVPLLKIEQLSEYIFESDARGFWITPEEKSSIIDAFKGLAI